MKNIKTYKQYESAEVNIDTPHLKYYTDIIFGDKFKYFEEICSRIEIMGYDYDHVGYEFFAYYMGEIDRLALDTIQEMIEDTYPDAEFEIEEFVYDYDSSGNPKKDTKLNVHIDFDKDFQRYWLITYGEDGIEDLLTMSKVLDDSLVSEFPELEYYFDSKELGII